MKILGFNITWGGKSNESPTDSEQELRREDAFYPPNTQQQYVKEEQVALPVNGGRESIPEGFGDIHSLFEDMAVATPDFELKLITVLQHLAKYNADLSYALDNIVQLGNTPYTISFDESVNETTAKEIKKYLETRKKDWYVYSGGLNSLINDLLVQACIGGAISAEMVPEKDLSRVKKVVLVNIPTIRFTYDKAEDNYSPSQQTNVLGINNGLKPLNTITYKYIAMRRFTESPYAIPPFLSALDSLAIEKDMMINFKHITKQLGVFGFLQVLMKAPARRQIGTADNPQPESEAEYQARCRQYLRDQVPEMVKSLNSGYVMGFKDTHEFDMQGNLSNPEGAIKLFNMNTEHKMAGLKQDPLMLGRNFSTTETIGRVILTKLSAQVANYQATIAAFLEDLFLLDINLQGWKINSVIVEFAKPMLNDQLKDEQAYAAKIANADALYASGVITQTQKAQMLGFDTPAEDAPVSMPDGSPFPDVSTDNTRTDPANTTSSNSFTITSEDIEAVEFEISANTPVLDYGLECSCSECKTLSYKFDFNDPKIQKFFDKYRKDTNENYSSAVEKQVNKIAKELVKLSKGASEQEVTDAIFFHLYKDWKAVFSAPQRTIITKWVSLSYKSFRKDKSVLAGYKGDIPETTFNFTDLRTIEYFKNSDDLYLGKFVTDPDTRKRMTAWIKSNYVEGNIPLGGDKESIKDFTANFGNLLVGEQWKIDRIIATTTNKLRNYAAIGSMTEAEVETYIIRGVNDRLQCAWCKEMQGKKFSVSKAQSQVDDFVKSDPSQLPLSNQLLNSVFKGEEGVKKLRESTNDELMTLGVALPSFHMNCRDVVVADL